MDLLHYIMLTDLHYSNDYINLHYLNDFKL